MYIFAFIQKGNSHAPTAPLPPTAYIYTYSFPLQGTEGLGLLQTQKGLIFLLPPAAFALEEVNSPFFLPPGPAPSKHLLAREQNHRMPKVGLPHLKDSPGPADVCCRPV